MKDDPRFTDEEIHRYIDGEIDEATKAELEAVIGRDPRLAARVRDYRAVDEAIREAFGAEEPPMPRVPDRPKRTYLGPIAAALLLPAGFSAGWLGHSLTTGPTVNEPLAAAVDLPTREQEHLNTVLHIDVDDPAVMERALDRAEAVLTAYADRDAQVEVVANAGGINLLRADVSDLAPRVRAMMDRYDNLSFVACANTIAKLRKQGVQVELIDRTHDRETALEHVVARVQAGWTYIKM